MIGTCLTGLFANPSYSGLAFATGSFYRSAMQLGIQCAGVTITIVYSSIATAIIYGTLFLAAKALKTSLTIPAGMAPDVSQHGETAYSRATTKAESTLKIAEVATVTAIEASAVNVA